MSLLDLIIDQKIILIGLLAALLPVAAALLLMIVKGFRRLVRQRVRRIPQKDAASAKDMARQTAEPEPHYSVQSTAATPLSKTHAQQPAASPVPGAEAAQPQARDSEVSDQIQSLLASVFSDETADKRYSVLLRHTTPIEIKELAARCQAVADQLHARGTERGA